MNNLKRAIKNSKTTIPRKQEAIKQELRRFREIKQNFNTTLNSSSLPKTNTSTPNISKGRRKSIENLSTILSPNTFKNLCHLKNDSILDTQYNEDESSVLMKNNQNKDLMEEIRVLKNRYEGEIKEKDAIIEDYKKEILLYKRLIENQGKENEVLKRELNQISYENAYKNPDSNISNPLILITNE